MNPEKKIASNSAWYLGQKFVILMLVLVGPLALPLMWFSPHFSRSWKICTTIIAVILAYILGQVTLTLYGFLQERLSDIEAASYA